MCLPISPRPRGLAGNENARLSLAFSRIWGGRWESNPRHQEPQSCALPTELRPPYCTCLTCCAVAHPAGLEPATIRLEGGCSIQLSYGRILWQQPRFRFEHRAFCFRPCSSSEANLMPAARGCQHFSEKFQTHMCYPAFVPPHAFARPSAHERMAATFSTP